MRRLGNSLLTTGLNRALGVKSTGGRIATGAALGAIRKWSRSSNTSRRSDHRSHRPVQPPVRVAMDLRTTSETQSPTVAVLLCLFLGWLGIHRFYLNRIGTGIIMLLLCWTFITIPWAIIDLIMILTGRLNRIPKTEEIANLDTISV